MKQVQRYHETFVTRSGTQTMSSSDSLLLQALIEMVTYLINYKVITITHGDEKQLLN